MRSVAKYVLLVALIAGAGAWTVTRGQTDMCPGCLDTTFGTGGVAAMNLSPNLIKKIAIQKVGSEDMIVAAGYGTWTLARHQASGTLDADFGVGGVVRKTFKKGSASLDGGVVVQPDDNKLVVAGYVPVAIGRNTVSTFAVARYNEDGTDDTSFGANGLVTVAASPDGPGMFSRATDLVLQPDGKIVVVAYAATADHNSCLSAVRLLANGQLDTSFGAGGLFSYRHTVGMITAGNAVAIQTVPDAQGQPEDRIVIAGGAQEPDATAGVREVGFLIRLTESGVPDGTFGTGGVATTRMLSARATYFSCVATDSLNRIVAAGAANYYPDPTHLLVARFDEDGTPDASFGTGGTFIHSALHNSGAYGIAIQPDGKILAAGYVDPTTSVWRLHSSGVLDDTFGSGGWVSLSSAQFWDITLVQKDDGTNAFVVGGRALVRNGKSTTSYWALWRYFY